MKLWQWQQGRQKETNYMKFPLWSFRIWKLGFDGYILKYPEPTVLSWHKDPVKGGKHWRMNMTLKGRSSFGQIINTRPVQSSKVINLFRADKIFHSLIVHTPTIKLSLGFVKFK